jgi:hypothetical protein
MTAVSGASSSSSQAGSSRKKHSTGGDPAMVKFVYRHDVGFEIGVYVDDEESSYRAFDDFWPSGEIWDMR